MMRLLNKKIEMENAAVRMNIRQEGNSLIYMPPNRSLFFPLLSFYVNNFFI